MEAFRVGCEGPRVSAIQLLRRFRKNLRYDAEMADEERLQRWVLETARMMADHPDAVSVEIRGTGERIALRLHVHPSDIGKMIGKQGRTGRALRTIGGAIAMTMSESWFTLDIADDNRLPVSEPE